MSVRQLVPLLLLAASTPAAEPQIIVERDKFQCLVDRIDQFVGKGNRITIDISRCPPSWKQGYLSIPTERGLATQLVVTNEQIRCIRAYRRDLSKIAKPVDGSYYALNFVSCRRNIK